MDDLIGAKNELTQTTEPAAIQRLKTKIKTLELLQQEREQVIRDTFFKVKQVPTQEEDVDPYKHEGTQRIGPNLSKYRQ